MTIRDEIQNAGNSALEQLRETQSFFNYDLWLWNSTLVEIKEKGRQFTLKSLETGQILDSAHFAKIASSYKYQLPAIALQRTVIVFENYLSKIFQLWIVNYPKAFSKRQIAFQQILELPDKDSIIDEFVSAEIQAIFYQHPRDWFNFLNTHCGLEKFDQDILAQFYEIKARRDLIVHGQNIINKSYVEKSASHAVGDLGDMLETNEPYVENAMLFIHKIIVHTQQAFSNKLRST